MQKVAQSWLVLDLTKSSFYLGLDDFLGQLPILLFTLIGGVIADRHDRRRLLLGSQYVQMATAFTLAALVFWERVHIWHILALSFIAGLAQAFGGPAYQSLVPSLVAQEGSAERDRAQLDPVQPRAGVRSAAGRRHAGARFGTALCFSAQRPLVPRRHRRADVAAHEAHHAGRAQTDPARAQGRPRLRAERAGDRRADRARVSDDVSGIAAADVPADLRARHLPRRRRPLQPDDGVLGGRRGRRRAGGRVARTLQAHGADAAARAAGRSAC